jgi:oligosaccharide repeat unit polymerase
MLIMPGIDQTELTAPIVLLSVIFTFSACVRLAQNKNDGQVDWFHPSILFMLVYLTYIMFSGVWVWLYHDHASIWLDFGSQPAHVVNTVFLLGAVSIASFTIGMSLNTQQLFPGKEIKQLLYKNAQFNSDEIRNVILWFFLIGGAFKLYHLSLYGVQLSDILRYLSPSAARELDVNISQAVIMFESMLDWSALLAVFLFMVRYKETGQVKGWWLILLFVVCVAAIDYVVSGKRSAVIFFVLMPLIWYHYLIKRMNMLSAVLFFMLGMLAIVGLLIARIVLPLLTQDLTPTDYIGTNPLEILAFYVDTGEWSTFDMFAASLVQRDEILHQSGGMIIGFLKYSFSTMIIFIPRAIWPGKPEYEDLSQVYFRVLVNPDDGAGFAPTIWGASYLFFGIAGLIIGMCVLGWLFKCAYAMFQPTQGRPLDVLVYSMFFWLAFQFLRFGTFGFITILIVQSMIMGMLAIYYLGRKQERVLQHEEKNLI